MEMIIIMAVVIVVKHFEMFVDVDVDVVMAVDVEVITVVCLLRLLLLLFPLLPARKPKGIKLPKLLTDAIETKAKAEQESARMEFVLSKERQVVISHGQVMHL